MRGGRERTDSFVASKNEQSDPLKEIRLGIRAMTERGY